MPAEPVYPVLPVKRRIPNTANLLEIAIKRRVNDIELVQADSVQIIIEHVVNVLVTELMLHVLVEAPAIGSEEEDTLS